MPCREFFWTPRSVSKNPENILNIGRIESRRLAFPKGTTYRRQKMAVMPKKTSKNLETI